MPPAAAALGDAKEKLEALYTAYNRRRFVHPDPLEFLYSYEDLKDREIVALIASSLAYGKVGQILKSVSTILLRMETSPFDFLCSSSFRELYTTFDDFKHRFTPGADISLLLCSAKTMIRKYGSLHRCFMVGYQDRHETILPALSAFVKVLRRDSCCWSGFLPSPERGSACKRLNLFLRWLVRKDEVDPGGWAGIPPSKLVVPLDTHMHRIGLTLRLTKRKQADLRTAVEITHAFKSVSPEDPVRYDFALTRFGIRPDMDGAGLLTVCGLGEAMDFETNPYTGELQDCGKKSEISRDGTDLPVGLVSNSLPHHF
jgi:uncharacterized protein (TIGR02757 family)